MSNKSLFNLSLIKKDMKILSPVFFVHIILLILIMPFVQTQALLSLRESTNYYTLEYAIESFSSQFSSLSISFVVAVITPILLFCQEKSSKSIEVLISLPFSRKQIFVNKLIVGFIVTILPTIVMNIITYFIIIANPMSSAFFNSDIFMFSFITTVLVQAVTFSYFSFIGMLFGNIFATIICGFIFTLMPVGIVAIVLAFINPSDAQILNDLLGYTPFFILVSSFTIRNSYIFLIIFTLILLVASMVLFEITKMEKNSEFLTFKSTEPFFRIGVFICSSFGFGVLLDAILMSFNNFSFFNKIIGFIIGGALGYLIPKAIITKSKVA